METSTLCMQLFKEMGVTVKVEDIDIAHRVPARKPSKYKPIICKFSRQIVKEQVISCRRNVNKINPKNIGLAAGAHLSEARVYDYLPPNLQNLLFEAKKFQQQYAYKFCWVKNSTVLLRKHEDSRPNVIKKLSDLETLQNNEG